MILILLMNLRIPVTSEVVNALKMDLKIFLFIQVGVYHSHALFQEKTKEITDHKKRVENWSWGKPGKRGEQQNIYKWKWIDWHCEMRQRRQKFFKQRGYGRGILVNTQQIYELGGETQVKLVLEATEWCWPWNRLCTGSEGGEWRSVTDPTGPGHVETMCTTGPRT